MFGLTVKVDTRQAMKVLEQAKKQMAYASVLALNSVAKNIAAAEQRGILETFRHPRPFTVKSLGIIYAKKATPAATIYIKDTTAKYLSAYEDGGAHYVPNRPELGRVILEPVHAKVDAYGQMTKAYVASMFANPNVFTGTIHGILGVWLRPPRGERQDGTKGTKGRLKLAPDGRGRTGLILLAKAVLNRPVTKHLDFAKRGEAIFREQFPGEFDAAFIRAMATAK